MSPLFAIITPTFNAADTVGRTLDSVDSQNFTDYEHVVVDGAGTDGTLTVVESRPNPRRRVFSEPDGGLYDAMNKGISRTTGRYLIFLNAGDKFHGPDTLRRIADAIAACPGEAPGVVYGQTVLVDDAGGNPRPRHLTATRELSLKSFATGMVVCHQAFVALRKITGFYSMDYRFSADYEWCIRCLQHSRRNVYVGDEPLVDYLDEGLTTKNRRRSLRERFRIMAYYYGFMPTVLRHVGFLFRDLRRRLISRKQKQ